MDEQKGEPTPDLGGRSEAKTALMYVSGLGLSEEERRKFEAYRDHKYADANRDRCESIKSALMTDSKGLVAGEACLLIVPQARRLSLC